MSTLADRLQKALQQKQSRDTAASQAELARYCVTSAPSVSDWFTGETKSLKAKSLVMAAEYLGVRARWLLDGAGSMQVLGHAQPVLRPLILPQALNVLGQELARDLAPDVRQDIADTLAKLAMRSGSPRHQAELVRLLAEAQSGKRTAKAA